MKQVKGVPFNEKPFFAGYRLDIFNYIVIFRDPIKKYDKGKRQSL